MQLGVTCARAAPPKCRGTSAACAARCRAALVQGRKEALVGAGSHSMFALGHRIRRAHPPSADRTHSLMPASPTPASSQPRAPHARAPTRPARTPAPYALCSLVAASADFHLTGALPSIFLPYPSTSMSSRGKPRRPSCAAPEARTRRRASVASGDEGTEATTPIWEACEAARREQVRVLRRCEHAQAVARDGAG